MPAFSTQEDIAARALQLCGAERLLAGETLAAPKSKGAREIAVCYDKMRVTEMSDHYWVFSLKRAVLRPIDTTTRLLTPPAWSNITTYLPGAIVSYNGDYWVSTTNDNLGNTPGTDGATVWDKYFGPLSVMPFDTSGATAYAAGELVYVVTGAGTYDVFASLQAGNSDPPETVTAFDPTVTYYKNQIVSQSSVNYQSLVDLNLGQTPPSASYWTTTLTFPAVSNKWLKITGATLSPIILSWPIGTGPLSDTSTRNVYRLPSGYLRRAPQDPKTGLVTPLGAPTGKMADDWLYEGVYFTSADGSALDYRFVADVTNVSAFDPCFADALAAKIAREIVEPLTQSADKYARIDRAYKEAMAGAVLRDAIERGPTVSVEDNYIACRL